MSQPIATPWRSSSLRVLLAAVALAAGCHGTQASATPDAGIITYPPANKKVGMTYYKDVLPITQVQCQGCHTAGGIAPFPLTTYDDAKKTAMLMSSAVQARRMPPWMPAATCQDFRDARTLTQDQIDTIFSWADDGAPAGNAADAPPPPPAPPGLAWTDRTLSPVTSYTPNAALTDDYHCFVLDPALVTDQTLIGYDFAPGVRAEVHHVLIYAATMTEAQAKDAATPELGYTCFGGPGLTTTQLVAAWVPGTGATMFPTDTGVPIKAGSALVMQIHYNLANGVAPDKSSLKLQLARQAVSRPAVLTPISQTKFSIPPMSTGYSISKSAPVPAAVTVWGVAPHQHLLGRRAHLELAAPGGATSCLLDIPNWDFHWQQFFFYKSPSGISLAAGSTITYTCTWDNPGSSAVTWGESTSDEMCITYLYITP
jgi:hypothetical protein